jgi:hypothetical protein
LGISVSFWMSVSSVHGSPFSQPAYSEVARLCAIGFKCK